MSRDEISLIIAKSTLHHEGLGGFCAGKSGLLDTDIYYTDTALWRNAPKPVIHNCMKEHY